MFLTDRKFTAAGEVLSAWTMLAGGEAASRDESAWRESTSNRVASLLRDAAHEADEFFATLDCIEPWSCERVELIALLQSAPAACLQGLLFAILECRAQWHGAQSLAGQTSGSDEYEITAAWADRLARDVDTLQERDSSSQWLALLDVTNLHAAARSDVDALFLAAPTDLWRGYLAGIIQWRAQTDHLLAGTPRLTS
jgi:hypothetical protein